MASGLYSCDHRLHHYNLASFVNRCVSRIQSVDPSRAGIEAIWLNVFVLYILTSSDT